MGKFLGRFYVCTVIFNSTLSCVLNAMQGNWGWFWWLAAFSQLYCMFLVEKGGVE